MVLANFGEVYLLQGELNASAQHLERAIQTAGKLSDTLILAERYRLYGELALEREAPGRVGLLWNCVLLGHRTGYPLGYGRDLSFDGSGIRCDPARSAGPVNVKLKANASIFPLNFGRARACLEESIATACSHGNTREEAKSRLELGVFEAEQGSTVSWSLSGRTSSLDLCSPWDGVLSTTR